jgi:HlyD family secretion protein
MTQDSSPNPRDELVRTLGLAAKHDRRRSLLWWTVVAVVGGTLVYGLLSMRRNEQAATPRYVTEEATRGNLVVTVSATGNLQPTNKVDVGSELSGTVEAVLVDDNDRVKQGQVLARLDTARLRDQVAKSRASLASAEAKVLQARATVGQSRSTLDRLREVARLSDGKVPSRSELEIAEATLARALADEASARAVVAEATAVVSSDETNLRKASIRSPIDGVVLARKVEPGQTVAASLQAPVLFTLAQTLSQMELQVDVDEADVGQIRDGLAASFSVDAYPARRYPAKLTRVSFGSQTKEGVVSYQTLLAVNNDDLTLRPGMTATAEIVVATRDDVLLVPNAALRYAPPVKPAAGGKKDGGIVSNLLPRAPGPAPKQPAQTKGSEQRVWVLRDGAAAVVRVTTGVTNGRHTEITGGDLAPGAQVVTESLGPAP